MAAAVSSLSFSLNLNLDSQSHQRTHFNLKNPLLHSQKTPSFRLKSFSSSSHSTTEDTPTATSASSIYSNLEDSFKPGRFLTNEELEKLRILQKFTYFQELKTGSLLITVMREEEMDMTVNLLAESFAESMLMPVGYVNLLRFLVKQYLVERRCVLPHAVTLVGFFIQKKDDFNGDGEENEEENEDRMVLAGTVEVCFDKRGANSSPPTPTPPKDSPYICNMTVKDTLRRRGIGWHLLKASEELISQMSSNSEVYLHCRMIDSAPFNMYLKAGYNVVKTDNILILLMLQRRKHLMCKKLPVVDNKTTDIDKLSDSSSNMEVSSPLD